MLTLINIIILISFHPKSSSSSSEDESNSSGHKSDGKLSNEPEVNEKGENTRDDEKETESEVAAQGPEDVQAATNNDPPESSPAGIKTRSGRGRGGRGGAKKKRGSD